MVGQVGRFDIVLDTAAASHDLDPYTALLRRNGTLVLLGIPDKAHPAPSFASLVFGRRAIAGSFIGGLPQTQEMLDFCAEHGIVCDIEMIAPAQLDAAFARLHKGDVRYRFVMDLEGPGPAMAGEA